MDDIITRIVTIREGVQQAKADLNRAWPGGSLKLLTVVAFASIWTVIHPIGLAWPFRSRRAISAAVGQWKLGRSPMWAVWFHRAAQPHLCYSAVASVGLAAAINGLGDDRQERQEMKDQSR